MKFTEKTGKTVEEAVKSALEELKTTKEQVEIKILEEPSKGIFGLIGTKPAKVRVVIVEDSKQIVTEFLDQMLQNMGIHAKYDIKLKKEKNILHVNVIGQDMGVLIGRRGQTLDAVQYLVSLVVNKDREDYLKVIIDTENYRKKREQTLIRLAKKLAYKVQTTKENVVLEPMNPYERRIIHAALQNHPKVVTKSEGEEPFRKVVIAMK
jgi:spoIIIJ-associated protein